MIRGYRLEDWQFVQLLDAFPEGLTTVRAYLLGGFGILVPDGPASRVWEAIVRDRSVNGAADVVAELVITKGGARVVELITRAAAGKRLFLRADDPTLARLLFQAEEDWDDSELGECIVDYFQRSRAFLDGEDDNDEGWEGDEGEEDWCDDEEDGEEPGEGEPDEEERGDGAGIRGGQATLVDLEALFSGKPRPSATQNAHWSLERIQTPPRAFLAVPPDWLEANLEEFLWLNWERLDLGLDRPLHLVGRQQRLRTGTADRVDLLARGSGGEWVAIELKIGEASIRALGQLMSYMADLERGGRERRKIRGILIASAFSSKAVNTAATDSRITLLRFAIQSEE